MRFELKRDMLFKQALEVNNVSELKDDFKREFFNLVGDIVIEMLDGDNDFFGQFMLKIERSIRLDITWPLATIPKLDGFIMYFNPILFLQNDRGEIAALFKHEIYHMMYRHYERSKELRNSYGNEAVAIALDITINQFIKNMPMEAKRLDGVSNEFNITLKSNRSADEYAEKIQNEINRIIKRSEKNINSNNIKREIDISTAHKVWEEINISTDTIKELTKKTALSIASKNPPEDINNILYGYLEKEELSWQEILKKFIPTVKMGYKKTITRRDRRQPNRVDLRGKLPNATCEILVAIDISASMTDDDMKNIMIEILAISKNRENKITVIECDNEIKRIYKLNSPKDIKARSKKTGSTAFNPVFKYIRENNLRDNILIYFTDGVGEKELDIKPINSKTLWVLTGDEELSLTTPFGEIRNIKSKKEVQDKSITGLSYMREVIHDWAR